MAVKPARPGRYRLTIARLNDQDKPPDFTIGADVMLGAEDDHGRPPTLEYFHQVAVDGMEEQLERLRKRGREVREKIARRDREQARAEKVAELEALGYTVSVADAVTEAQDAEAMDDHDRQEGPPPK